MAKSFLFYEATKYFHVSGAVAIEREYKYDGKNTFLLFLSYDWSGGESSCTETTEYVVCKIA